MRRARHHSTTRPHTLGEHLLHLARRYAAEEAHELDDLAIGPAQHALLDLVVAQPGISMAFAARYLDVDKAALSRTARRLVRNGLLLKNRSRSDARVRELHATSTGRAVRWAASPGNATADARMMVGFSKQELSQLRLFLTRLEANLDITMEEFCRRGMVSGIGRPGLMVDRSTDPAPTMPDRRPPDR
ncbi:MAG: MarR family transcriptional regulator [bacterium]|nr:MarR family transcriptional regulator [bacterium]